MLAGTGFSLYVSLQVGVDFNVLLESVALRCGFAGFTVEVCRVCCFGYRFVVLLGGVLLDLFDLCLDLQ